MTDILNTGAMAETKEFNFTYSAKQREKIAPKIIELSNEISM